MDNLDEILKRSIESIKTAIESDNIVGKPIVNGDGTVILPISKVSYGFVVGGGEYGTGKKDAPRSDDKYPHASASGGGVTVTPLGFLICGREKIFVGVDGQTNASNKWVDLLKSVANTMKKD